MTLPLAWLLLCASALISLCIQPAGGSGFMRWTRSYNEKSEEGKFSLFSSVADVTVVFISDTESVDTVDVINSTTGELLINTTEAVGLDLVAMVRPATLSNGQPSCMPLFTNSEMQNSILFAPWNGDWCGVFLMSSTDTSIAPSVLLPNGTSIAFKSTPPWSCTPEVPCTMRSTEQRESQLGGCPRRSATVIKSQGQGALAESSLVSVISGSTAYVFRPLLAVVSLNAIKSVQLEKWAAPIAFPDAEFMFQPITFVVGGNSYLGQNSSVTYATTSQGLICALILASRDGVLQLYDADVDDPNKPSGLAYYGNITTPFDNGMYPNCTPSVQVSLKMVPGPSVAVPTEVPPLVEPLYQSVLSVTCSYGSGFMWTAVVQNVTTSSPSPSPYGITWTPSGTYQLPPAGPTPRPGVPLAMDIEILLVQPTITVANGLASPADSSSFVASPFSYLSSGYQYVTCVSASLIFFNEASDTTLDPFLSLVVFMSNAGDTGMSLFPYQEDEEGVLEPVEGDMFVEELPMADSSNVTVLNLTTTQVSSLTPSRMNITKVRSGLISNVMGWVHAASLPAMANATVTLNATVNNETRPSFAAAKGVSALEQLVLSAATEWLAHHGTTYSVLVDDCLLFVNLTTGGAVPVTKFSASPDGSKLYGGISDASTSRIGPFTSATVVPQLLDWQSTTSPVAVAINRSANAITHTKVLISTSPPGSGAGYPLCVFTLVGTSGALMVNVNVTFAQSTKNSSIPNQTLHAPNYEYFVLSWVEMPENDVLLDTFSQNVCTVELPAGVPSASNVAPAGGLLFLTQVFQLPGQSTSIRISANPVRSAVATTSQTSFALDYNATVASTTSITTLDPVGTPFIFVCAGRTLYAYYLTAGNLSWTGDFSDLPGCANCTCPNSNDALLLSQDRRYVLLTVINGTHGNSPNALLILDIETFDVANVSSSYIQETASNECTNGESSDPFVPILSPVIELTNDLKTSEDSGVRFRGVLTFVGTRCFALISVSVDANGLVADLSLYFFLGSSSAFSPAILYHGDNLYLSNQPNPSSNPLSNVYYSVWSFSFDNLLNVAESDNDDDNLYGVLPTFATGGVMSCTIVSSIFMATTISPQGVISMQAFDPSLQSGALWTDTITFDFWLPGVQLSLVSSFVALNRFACVAAGVLVCYEAAHSMGQIFRLWNTAQVPHIGMPAVDQLGNIVFATQGYQTHAVLFGPSTNLTLSLLWSTPNWPGMNSGVDMDINTTTCSNPLISDEGLVLECTPLFNPNPEFMQRHVFILIALTGVVLLGGGPRVVPSSSTLSDNGLYITYANDLGSAISINLVGSSRLMEVPFEGSLCVTDLNNNYVVTFNHTTITAVKVPWNVSELSTVRTYLNGLQASRWKAYGGLMLGNTFTLNNSTGIIRSLWDALPSAVRAAGIFNVYMGSTVRIMDVDFGYTIMDTSQCAICLVSCPFYCTVSLIDGTQRELTVSSGSLMIRTKPSGASHFSSNQTVLPILYSGNYTLNLLRLQQEMASLEQVIECGENQTIVAPSGRYCLLAPKLNLKRWAVVEIGRSIATTAVYQSSWDDPDYSQVQSSMGGVVYSVNNVVAINNLLQIGSIANSFPQYLNTNGLPFSSVQSVTTTGNASSNLTLVIATDTGDFDAFTSGNCEVMEKDIPLCSSHNIWYNSHMTSYDQKSIAWQSSDTGDSNWGNGFIRAGFATKLSNVMRSIASGEAAQCGRANDDCEVSCQPSTQCESQIRSYWSNWLSVMSLMPLGSSMPFPGTALQACSLNTSTNNVSYTPYPNVDQFVMDPQVTLRCTTNNMVAITTKMNQWYSTSDSDVVVALIPVGSPSTVTGGATFTCTECTYFLLTGVVPEPFGWLGVGAVKNLVVCILFYWMMERVKGRQRGLNESLRRIKRQKKQLAALRFRLAAHDPSFPQMDSNANFTFHKESVLAFKHAQNNNAQTRVSDLTFTTGNGISSKFVGGDQMVRQSEESLSSFQERAQPEEEMDGQPLRYLPFAYSAPISTLTAEEKRTEKQEIKVTIEQLERSLVIDQSAHQNLIHEHRFCGWFPNPLDIYAAVLVRCGRFRRYEDRRMYMTRIKDNFVYKEFTPESLVEMLMAILGESPSNRAQVVSFAHFYQWNLCDNRQWVVREHVDEQSQYTSTEVIQSMERELQRVHNKLQDVYVMYKVAFRGRILTAPARANAGGGVVNTFMDHGLASGVEWKPPDAPRQSTASSPAFTDIAEREAAVAAPPHAHVPQVEVEPINETVSHSLSEDASSALTGGGIERTSSYTLLPNAQRQRKTRLENLEHNFNQAIQQAQEGGTPGAVNQLGNPLSNDAESLGQIIGSGANFADEVKFKGMDAFAPRRLHNMTSFETPSAGRMTAASKPLLGDDKIKKVTSSHNLYNSDGEDEADGERRSRASVSSFKSVKQRVWGNSKTPNSLRRFLGDIDVDEEVAIMYATHQLGKQVEEFNQLHEKKPHCFEYVSLPSRKIDDKLLPSPLLIIFSLMETVITLIVYGSDVLLRSMRGTDGYIKPFDVYQCVFFLAFNSSLPSSLIVNVIARADLGKTTHTKNALEKVKDIITNPYVVVSLVIFATPIVTHVIPGFVAYIWLMGPPLALLGGLEYYLRTRFTVHSHAFVIARLVSRVAILFASAIVMSLSFNYSTSLMWGDGGYLSTGSYVQGTYWDAVANDYDSRSFKCTWDHILFTISNFVQMGFVLL